MTDLLQQPDFIARIDGLAERIGCAGPDARNQVLERAVKVLESHYPARRKLTPAEQAESDTFWEGLRERAHQRSQEYRAERMQRYLDAGVKYREENPYDDDNPPSKVWQEELYDESGLPK